MNEDYNYYSRSERDYIGIVRDGGIVASWVSSVTCHLWYTLKELLSGGYRSNKARHVARLTIMKKKSDQKP